MSILNLLFGWDEVSPAGQDLMSSVDDRIRELKTSVRQVVGVDHVFNTNAPFDHFGKHKQITLRNAQSAPAADTGSSILYAKGADKTINIMFEDLSEDKLFKNSQIIKSQTDLNPIFSPLAEDTIYLVYE
jgi:hypothetical protein